MQHVQLGELYLETPPGSCDSVTNANVQNDSNGANTCSHESREGDYLDVFSTPTTIEDSKMTKLTS